MARIKYLSIKHHTKPPAEEYLLDEDSFLTQQTTNDRSTKIPTEIKEKTSLTQWKRTLYIGSGSSVFVLLFNTAFVVWAAQHDTVQNGRGVLFTGDCDKGRKINTGLHLVINILSTILLSASNYGMQCLCAPTRNDINRAHRRGKWLDIGVPSLRNLTSISHRKSILWICLALSSLPLHLVYNSAIFITISSYEYWPYIGNGTTSFNLNTTRHPNGWYFTYYTDNDPTQYPIYQALWGKAAKGELYNLSSKDCISAYATNFQSTYGSVILVAEFNSSSFDFDIAGYNGGAVYQPGRDPYSWICSGDQAAPMFCSSSISEILSSPDSWTVTGVDSYETYKIKYCLSEKVPGMCKVEYSLPWALVAIGFNLVKAIILCGVCLIVKDLPILTTGDAVASFIKKPESITKGKSLLSRELVGKMMDGPWPFEAKPRQWGSAVSIKRWIICSSLYIISIVISIVFFYIGLSTGNDTSSTWTAGLGTVTPQAMVQGKGFPTTLLPITLIVNTPQTVFSLLYFTTNSVFTAMASSAEWSKYALDRKGLRVSTSPKGHQRSTYFLSLPYRCAIPLLVLSTLLHWLISQSFFLVNVEMYDALFQRGPSSDVMTCGFSPVAIVSTLSVGAVLIVYLLVMSFKRFKSGMPVAGSCSLAISAACHPPSTGSNIEDDNSSDYIQEELGISTLPLKWGAVSVGEVGHCTFSSEEVEMPQDGCIYE